MKEVKLYIAETPGGAYKAYVVGYGDEHKPGANSRTKYKSVPDQPFRGFESTEEVRLFLLEKFGNYKSLSEWAESCGNGSLCLKDISQWEEMLLPGSKRSGQKKTRKKRNANVATKRMVAKVPEAEPEEEEEEEEEEPPFNEEPVVKRNKIENKTLGIPIQVKEENAANKFTYQQYKHIADGVVQEFENTLLSCMVYNVNMNAANLVHAYRALKLINVLQWTAALEAARMAAAQDSTWTKYYESILNANKVVGLPI